LVDDEAHILQVLSLKLRNAGYIIKTAADGEEAFEVASRDAPDLIITDFQMPYMTGLELCRALKDHASTANVPVIMLTARGYALSDGDLGIGNIRKVLSKPFSPRSIVQLVNETLGTEGTACAAATEPALVRPGGGNRQTGGPECGWSTRSGSDTTQHLGTPGHSEAA
jgi:CheY-like chemotaxis protein